MPVSWYRKDLFPRKNRLVNSNDICDVAARIETRSDFIKFLRLLEINAAFHSRDWENDTLATFVAAMGNWTNDCDGYFKNMGQEVCPDTPTWKLFAEILLAAKVYE